MQKDSSIINNIEVKLKAAMSVMGDSPTESLELATKALELSESCSFLLGIVKSNIIIAKSYIYKGNMGLAMQFSENTLTLLGDNSGLGYEFAELQLCLGNIHYYLGNYDLALEYITNNTKSDNKNIDNILKAKSLTLEGNVYCRLNCFSDAFSCFKKSLELKRESNQNGESIAKSLMNLATVFIHLDDFQKALRYTKEASKYLNDTSSYSKCIILLNIGVILGKQGVFKEAVEYLESSLEICDDSDLDRLKASALSNLGEFHYLSGNIEKALTYSQEGISLCDSLNFKNNIYVTCMLTLFRCHHANGALEAAADIGKETLPLCQEIGYNDLATDLLRELITVLEKLGRINEALDISKKLLGLQEDIYKKKRDFGVFQIQSKLEVQMKEQELEMQREFIEQQQKHNKELTVLNEELDNFVGIASHDLKEPIRTINSFSKILGRYISEDQKEYEFLHFIQDASERMGILVEDLLSFARAGKITSVAKCVDLMGIMTLVEQNMKTTMHVSKAKLEYENLPTISGHFTPLMQLFQNIIANAIKYCKPGVVPVIQIQHEVTDDGIRIVFKDNGIGIDVRKVDAIFDPFTRVHSKTDQKGSGIGLATCKRIVEQYNGKIWATSEVGVGTEIHIFIPNTKHNSDASVQILRNI